MHDNNLDKSNFELITDIPSVCADKLQSGKVDLALIPVAAVPKIPDARIISNFCIGASGAVKTVMLLSDVPLHKIKRILLDYQSRTSVKLVRILAQKHWHIDVEFVNADIGYESDIKGDTAGLIIGDRVFRLNKNFKYQYDLSAEWQQMTKLPFVFAAWTANKELPQEFITRFNAACAFGLQNIDTIIEKFTADNPNHNLPLQQYLTKDISYALDAEKRKAMNLFWQYIRNL